MQTRAREALHKSGSDRLANAGENDGYGRTGDLGSLGSLCSEPRNDHTRFGVEEIGHKLRQSRRLPFGYAEVKNKMLPSV
jgi:hypothetical protein